MSASTFLLGKGGTLSTAATSNGTATPVNQLQKITFSGAKADYADVTNLSSPSNFREVAPTLLDSGNASFTGVYAVNDAGQQGLVTAFNDQSLLYVSVQFAPTGAQTVGLLVSFTAYVSDLPLPDMSYDGAASFNGTLKITGPVTLTAGH
jgi:hypothetical protein